MRYIRVTDTYIKNSNEFAIDLYGLALMGNDAQLKKILRKHIKDSDKYLKEKEKLC